MKYIVVSKLHLLLDELTSVDVATLSAGDAVSLLRELTPVKRRIEALCSSLSARAVAGDSHVGAKNASEFIAGLTGVSERDAGKALACQRRLDNLPAVKDAVASGEVSAEQGNAIAQGADGDEELASELLSGASAKKVEDIQAKARKLARERSASEEEHHYKLRSKRSLSLWKDPDGLINILIKLTPEMAADFVSKQRSFEDNLVREEGSSWANHRADAFCALIGDALSQDRGSSHDRDRVVVHVDYEAFMRGCSEPGESCEVAGLGDIPVSYAQSLLDDCVLQVIITQKNRVVWFGGTDTQLPERIKQAVIARSHNKCDRCSSDEHLQVDHIVPRVKGGSHDFDNLQCLCWQCHRIKTQTRDAPWTSSKIYGKERSPPAA